MVVRYLVHVGINMGQIKKKHNGSHIHTVPGTTTKNYIIISEYMRYKYNQRGPVKQQRALKI